MPTWGEIENEIMQTVVNGTPDFDGVRRKYLAQLYKYTGNPVILYSTAYLEKPETPSGAVMLTLADIQGFMGAVKGLPKGPLDLILHSPGGMAEAAESVLNYLRQRFNPIRVFIPVAAMSAATMLALGCDEIVMGAHSQLGPIDPQLGMPNPNGNGMIHVPARALLDEFQRAQTECRDPAKLPVWMPILRGYHPGLLQLCVTQQALARDMVGQWLATYMFRRRRNRTQLGRDVATWFADHGNFKSHSRQVSRAQARSQHLRVIDLESDSTLQDLVLSVHHATSHVFSHTAAVKIIENHQGVAFIRSAGTTQGVVMRIPLGPIPGQAPVPGIPFPFPIPAPGGSPPTPGTP